MPRKPFLIAVLAVGSAVLLAMLEATQTWARMRSFGQDFDWLRGFGRALLVWMAVVAISAPAFAFARRYRLDRAGRVPAHVGAALGFALVASFVSGTIVALQNRDVAFWLMVGKAVTFSTIYYFILY